MKIFTRKPGLLAASLWLACLPQAVLASSQYNASVDFSYTVTASNPNLNPDLLFLSVISDLQLNPALESGSSTYNFLNQAFAGFGVQHNIALQAQDGIALGSAVSDYFSGLLIRFENTSTDANDVADIRVDFNYRLRAQATAAVAEVDFADVDASLAFSNESFSVEGFDYAHASSQFGGFAEQLGSGAFNFVLAAGERENLYFDSAIRGQLEATVVPVPAAVWLFGSSLLGLFVGQRSRVFVPA